MILFEKYQVTDVIYESDTVTVYMVEHIYMWTKRIIKKILKKSICRDSFYSEINILKSIKNPQIPIIYDVEEDNLAYYIIEEYVAGDNLYTFINEHGVMSESEAIDIGIKICQIVAFLHGHKPIPILFLDVHPKNIIINKSENNKIFLVDFGSSYYSNETEKRRLLMGAVGYAAPEQYKHGRLDERADIYGIGAVLYFLVTGRSCEERDALSMNFPTSITEKFKTIIMQCLAHDKDDRFQSVAKVCKILSGIQKSDNISTMEEKSYIISFAGTDRRVGVTHISLGFALYLSRQGYSVMYEEANPSNHLRMIAGYYKMKYRDGFFYHDKLELKPMYGEQICLESQRTYRVRDAGIFEDKIIRESNVTAVVAAAKPWEIDKAVSVCKDVADKVHILCNGSNRQEAQQLWKRLGCPGIQVPVLNDIICSKQDNDRFYAELADVIGIFKEGGVANKKGKRFFKKIAEKARSNSGRHLGRS